MVNIFFWSIDVGLEQQNNTGSAEKKLNYTNTNVLSSTMRLLTSLLLKRKQVVQI